jgi:uncharacterized protein YggE
MSEIVVVRGTGTLEAQPDAAGLRIEARSRARDSASAHRDVAAVAAAIDAVLDQHPAAIRKRSTTGLLVTPAYEWTDKGQRSVGWDGVRTATVEITDPSAIGAVFAGVADAGGIASSLQWLLDPANPAHAAARTAAAVDARARAEAYAAALGVALGPVLEIREPSTYPPGGGGGYAPQQALFARAAGGAAAEVAVEVPDLHVVAEVDVTFALLG